MSSAVEFDRVSKVYRLGLIGRAERVAAEDVSFSIPTGCVFGLLGPNRAGKTTLVKILLSLVRPTGGTTTRLGAPLENRSTLARVGYVHENHAFPKYLTAKSLLDYYGALSLLSFEVVRERAPKLLERVGLADRANDPIRTYSKGMTQRLGIAQALLNDPDLLVLDEPSEGLDLEGRTLIADIVRERRAAGKTVLVVSHVLREIEPLVDRIAVMVAGRLAFEGTAAKLTGTNGSRVSLEESLRHLYARQAS